MIGLMLDDWIDAWNAFMIGFMLDDWIDTS